MLGARRLFEQGRFAGALELATAAAPADPGYASGRLVAVRVLLEQARFAELSDLLSTVPADVLTRDEDGRVLDLWRSYLRALELPTGRGDVVTEAADRFAATARDGSTERLRVEASALAARTTRLRVAYAELPHTANAEAAEEFGRAADGYRRLGLPADADTAALLRCRALRALPDEPTGPLTAALDEVAAAARARGDALSEASARLEALDMRTVAALREPRPGSLDGVLAECSAIGGSLDAAGHAFGPARAEWTVLAPLLQHLAGHAAASVTDGMAAGVELAGGDLLRARDLLLAPIRSDLVVLSGCETGVSEQRPGDEGVGLVRALLHGGAGALLTSQWQVPDGSAQRLLTAFHTHHTRMSRADALRRAMRDAAARPGREHFHHWGAFVLVGDWR